MGDPRRQINKYSTPRHPWESDRLAEEKGLSGEYGLKTKKEIWKEDSFIKNIKKHVKRLNDEVGEQAEKEQTDLFNKLISLNLLKEGQSLDEALELTVKDILERRLQTQVVRQGLARTMKQARQFIVHGHITIAGKKITAPGYHVSKEDQFKLEFLKTSDLADPEHPERKVPELEVPVTEETAKTDEEVVDEEVTEKLGETLSKDEAQTEGEEAVEKESQEDVKDEIKAATEVKNE